MNLLQTKYWDQSEQNGITSNLPLFDYTHRKRHCYRSILCEWFHCRMLEFVRLRGTSSLHGPVKSNVFLYACYCLMSNVLFTLNKVRRVDLLNTLLSNMKKVLWIWLKDIRYMFDRKMTNDCDHVWWISRGRNM